MLKTLRLALLPFSILFGFVVLLRNWLFEMGVLPARRVDVPVVSVGALSVGGVGKTPLVEYLARRLQGEGQKVAVLSRGYKRRSTGYVVVSNGKQRCAEVWDSGDEPAQLAEKLDGVIVAVDERRVRGAKRLLHDFSPDVIILDDGFQHRYLARDLDVVVVAADEVRQPAWLLPAGNLREPYGSLRRADVVIVSRCRNRDDFEFVSGILQRYTETPMIAVRTMAVKARRVGVGGEAVALEHLRGKKAVLLSGIGYPDGFEETVRDVGIALVHHFRFADHHQFTEQELQAVARMARQAELILTTEKDAARMVGTGALFEHVFSDLAVYAVEVRPEVLVGEAIITANLAGLFVPSRS
jgi:tetraacyldisaccharide 4'-kinase